MNRTGHQTDREQHMASLMETMARHNQRKQNYERIVAHFRYKIEQLEIINTQILNTMKRVNATPNDSISYPADCPTSYNNDYGDRRSENSYAGYDSLHEESGYPSNYSHNRSPNYPPNYRPNYPPNYSPNYPPNDSPSYHSPNYSPSYYSPNHSPYPLQRWWSCNRRELSCEHLIIRAIK